MEAFECLKTTNKHPLEGAGGNFLMQTNCFVHDGGVETLTRKDADPLSVSGVLGFPVTGKGPGFGVEAAVLAVDLLVLGFVSDILAVRSF